MSIAILYLAIGAIFGLMIGLMAAASAERHRIAPVKEKTPIPVYVPRFDFIEDSKGNLYSFDTKTREFELLYGEDIFRNVARKTKVQP